jgi:hypothetical protein
VTSVAKNKHLFPRHQEQLKNIEMSCQQRSQSGLFDCVL